MKFYLINFKKNKRCSCTMKESLAYINTNVECSYKFQNNTKDYMFKYIKHLPKTQYFRRGLTHRF